jgi:hypothetical protein
MDKTRHIKVALLFGAFTAIIAMVVQIIAMAMIDASVTSKTFIAAAVDGACIFVASFLTVLFVWPRIGFVPFDSHPHTPS